MSNSTGSSHCENQLNKSKVRECTLLRSSTVIFVMSQVNAKLLQEAETGLILLSAAHELLYREESATIESILFSSVTGWYGSCTGKDRKDLARVVRTAHGIVGCPLPNLASIHAGRVKKRARCIAVDPFPPGLRTVCTASFRKLVQKHKNAHHQTERQLLH